MNAPRTNPRLLKALGAKPNAPLTRKERERMRPPAHVSIIAQQPDDRPTDPNMYRSRSWVGVNDITYTERQSTVLTGWAGIVAASARMDQSGSGHNKRTPIR